VRAYIVGFCIRLWIAVLGLLVMTRAPPGPFTPEPFSVAKVFLRKSGASVR
jgi:MFS transporter, DHA2 family, multidrug resistance protein